MQKVVGSSPIIKGLLYEEDRGLYDASALAVSYEEQFEPTAWRGANRLRTQIRDDLAVTFENGAPFRTYDGGESAFGDSPIGEPLEKSLAWRALRVAALLEARGIGVAATERTR